VAAGAIRTTRLILRPPRGEGPALVALLNDWELIKNTAALPFPFTARDANDWLAQDEEQMACDRILLRKAIAVADSDTLIGAVDLFERDGEACIAYWIGRQHWGQGYATEAARAFVAHVFASTKFDNLRAGTFVENAASARVLEKLGFVERGEFDIDAPERGGRRRVRRYHRARTPADPPAPAVTRLGAQSGYEG
jgi:RimJ/RimL family protein N-acetyltransferase